MHRWAHFALVPFTIVILTAPALASQAAPSSLLSASSPADAKSKAEKEKEVIARHQAALTLLDLVLVGARNLSLPQNRIAAASEAFLLVWRRNEPQARSLVT